MQPCFKIKTDKLTMHRVNASYNGFNEKNARLIQRHNLIQGIVSLNLDVDENDIKTIS